MELHGAEPAAVGWRDLETQQLRFDKLIQVIGDTRAPFTVNDHGCGYGSMFEYLVERSLPVASYTGTDISPDMLAAARSRVHDARARFLQASEPPEVADYTFVSGTFNVRLGTPEQTWEQYVLATLGTLAARSRKGLAFNLLTDQVDWRDDKLFYANPCRFFDFCRLELSRRVALLHDYPLYEWTILVSFDRE